MGEAKKTNIKCAGCGKQIQVMTGDGHTGIAKCDCGATTTVRGEPGAAFEQINEILAKIPDILREFRQSRRKGLETGLDDAVHAIAMELAAEILREDYKLREKLKSQVREALEGGFGVEGDLEG